MSRLAELIGHFDLTEGIHESRLPGVRIIRISRHIPRTPLVYDPGICIIAQGHKAGYLGKKTFRFGANQYLLVSTIIPFECEAFATPEKSLLGIYIDIDLPQLNELISHLRQTVEFDTAEQNRIPQAIGPATMDKTMLDTVTRLLLSLQSDIESRILGPGLKREVLYRVLLGKQAPMLYALANHDSQFSRIAKVIKIIQSEFAGDYNVKQMARLANMSISAFHRAFKEVTADSPMQYLKKIRLNKAKDLMLRQGMRAYEAADRVGYESASQFSREFKRYYGQNYTEIIKEWKSQIL